MPTPFISRTFDLEHPDGTHTPVTLRINQPVPTPDDDLGGFQCTYFMEHFWDEPKSAWGADSLRALKQGLAHAQAWLRAKNEDVRGTLRWQGARSRTSSRSRRATSPAYKCNRRHVS